MTDVRPSPEMLDAMAANRREAPLRQLRFDSPPLIGTVIDVDWAYFTVLEVEPDQSAPYSLRYDWGAPDAQPTQWVATLRPATEQEIAKSREGWEQLPTVVEPSWWQRLFR